MIEISGPTELDIAYVANNMRASDRREVWLTSRREPLEALKRSVGLSFDARVLFLRGAPAAIYGAYRPVLGDTSVPWLLGTDAIDEQPKTFLRACKGAIRDWKGTARRLENRVVADNDTSIRFLQCLGFAVGEPQISETGAAVRPFWMEGSYV